MGELAKLLSIIYHQSLAYQGGLRQMELANVMPIHRQGCKEDPGNHRPLSLTPVPAKPTK